MKEIKVTDCSDCPFCQLDMWAINWECWYPGWERNGGASDRTICDAEGSMDTPEWCPLTELKITKE